MTELALQPTPERAVVDERTFEVMVDRYIYEEISLLANLNPTIPEMGIRALLDPKNYQPIIAHIDEAIAYASQTTVGFSLDRKTVLAKMEALAVTALDHALEGQIAQGNINDDILLAIQTPPFTSKMVASQMDRWLEKAVRAQEASNVYANPDKAKAQYAAVAGHYGLRYSVSSPSPIEGYKEKQLHDNITKAYLAGDTSRLNGLIEVARLAYGIRLDVNEIPSVIDMAKAVASKRGAELAKSLKVGARASLAVATRASRVATAQTKKTAIGLTERLRDPKVVRNIARGGTAGALAVTLTVPGAKAFAAESTDTSSTEVEEVSLQYEQVDVSDATVEVDVVADNQTVTVSVETAQDVTIGTEPVPQEPQAITAATDEATLEVVPEQTLEPVATNQTEIAPVPLVEQEDPDIEFKEFEEPTTVNEDLTDAEQIRQLITGGNLPGAAARIESLYGNGRTAAANPKLQQYARLLLQDFNDRLQTSSLDAEKLHDIYTALAYLNAGLRQPNILDGLPADVAAKDLTINLQTADLELVNFRAEQLASELSAPANGSFNGFNEAQQKVLTNLLAQMQVSLLTDAERQEMVNTIKPEQAEEPATPAPEATSQPPIPEVAAPYNERISGVIESINDERQKVFIEALLPAIEHALPEAGVVNVNVMLAQAIYENEKRVDDSVLPPYNNLFGIEADENWTGAIFDLPVTRERNGQQYITTLHLRAYDSLEAAILDYVAILQADHTDTLTLKDDEAAYMDALFLNEQEYKNEIYAIIELYGLRDLTSIVAEKVQAETAAREAAADAERQRLAEEHARAAAEAAGEIIVPPTPSEQEFYAMAAQAMIEKGGEWTNRGIAFKYFVEHGFTPDQAAGILGNLIVESHMDPNISQYGGGPGRGIAQWGTYNIPAGYSDEFDRFGHGEREGRVGLTRFAAEQGKPWNDLGVQLDFIMYEFSTTETRAFNAVKAATDFRAAALEFEDKFERAGIPNMDNRYESAEAVMAEFNANLQAARDNVAAAQADANRRIEEARVAAEAAARAAEEAARAAAAQTGQWADGIAIRDQLKAEYDRVSGRLSDSELATIAGCYNDGSSMDMQFHPEAARGFIALNEAFKAQFGRNLCITDDYRSYDAQVDVRNRKGSFAARPGTSNHGWGLAMDAASGINTEGTPEHEWMEQNAYKFGWVNPRWAHDDDESNGRTEPWHWEWWGSRATLDESN